MKRAKSKRWTAEEIGRIIEICGAATGCRQKTIMDEFGITRAQYDAISSKLRAMCMIDRGTTGFAPGAADFAINDDRAEITARQDEDFGRAYAAAIGRPYEDARDTDRHAFVPHADRMGMWRSAMNRITTPKRIAA